MRRTLAILAAPLALAACKKPDPQPAAPVDAGPPKSWCERQTPAHAECEDFDGPAFDVATRVVRVGGDARLVPGEASKPGAISFLTTPVDAASGDLSGAWMMTTTGIDHPVREAHVGFAVKLGDITATAAAPLQIFSMGIGSYLVVLEADAGAVRLVESYMGADAGAKRRVLSPSKPPTRGAWHEVAIDLAAASLTLAIDGERASSEPLPLASGSKKAFVIVGVRQPGAPTANEVSFDDVTIDVR